MSYFIQFFNVDCNFIEIDNIDHNNKDEKENENENNDDIDDGNNDNHSLEMIEEILVCNENIDRKDVQTIRIGLTHFKKEMIRTFKACIKRNYDSQIIVKKLIECVQDYRIAQYHQPKRGQI